MRWLDRWLRKRVPNGTSEYREFVEHRLKATRNMTPLYERLAGHLADLPAEEMAERMRQAMTRRPT